MLLPVSICFSRLRHVKVSQHRKNTPMLPQLVASTAEFELKFKQDDTNTPKKLDAWCVACDDVASSTAHKVHTLTACWCAAVHEPCQRHAVGFSAQRDGSGAQGRSPAATHRLHLQPERPQPAWQAPPEALSQWQEEGCRLKPHRP